MPRGDKPTTVALALKDGWVYEDALPEMTKEQYDWWFKESLVLDGVRMGPPLTQNTPDNEPGEALKPLTEKELRRMETWAGASISDPQPYEDLMVLAQKTDEYLQRALQEIRRSRASVAAVARDEGKVYKAALETISESKCKGECPRIAILALCSVIFRHCKDVQLPHGIRGLEDDLTAALSKHFTFDALDEAIREAEDDLRITCPEMFGGKPISFKRGSE